MEGGILTLGQALFLSSILGWILASIFFDLTLRLRALLRPPIARRVAADLPHILRIQRIHNGFLDFFFSAISCIVSVPFYTSFLPILFWSGHSRLARQMTLLMAFCVYIGDLIKDGVSAPRPPCPPARRVTATKDEEDNAMEYGLPSSHALNTVCLLGYLLHYVLNSNIEMDAATTFIGFALAFLLVLMIGTARIYLGMHSLVDVAAGTCTGLVVLAFWLTIDGYIDEFIINGRNVTSFLVCFSFLVSFAYPTPEKPTPSFEYHAAFTGVSFGIISGVHQTYRQFHSEGVPRIFGPQLPLLVFVGRVLVGIPTILLVKSCTKAITKRFLPIMCNAFGIPIWSSSYIPALKGSKCVKGTPTGKQMGCFQRVMPVFPQKTFDVDTGIRVLQYAGLAWSVVDLVPTIFYQLNL